MALSTKKKISAGMFVLLLAALFLFFYMGSRSSEGNSKPDQPINTSLLKSLRQQENKNVNISHLDASLLPPTNKWFSGMVFGEQPVFPLPYSFKPTNNSFEIGLPKVTVTPNTIFGSHTAAITVLVPDAKNYKITYYDDLVTRLAYIDTKDQSTATVTVAEGSPYIYYRAGHEQTLNVNSSRPPKKIKDNLYTITNGGQNYAFAVSGNSKLASANNALAITLAQKELLTIYAIPQSSAAESLYAYAQNELKESKVTWKDSGDSVKTHIELVTDNGKPTLFAAMPHHTISDGQRYPGAYDTIYGQARLYDSNNISYTMPRVQPSGALDLSGITAEKKATLLTQLKVDAAATNLLKTDSYFGGKELYRAANLLDISEELGDQNTAQELTNKLNTALNEWLDPKGYEKRFNRYFYYDTKLKGLVATEPSFGSEDFNDHHFHYGYFIYAASILAKYQPDFKNKHEDFINLIVADIASIKPSTYFPARRVFDIYQGHSWASGNGQFADGNNQESSSEAINAWNAVALWAAETDNSPLRSQATWMLSNEVASADKYWLNIDAAERQYQGYQHNIISLNWGGKRDYATFFSAEPAAQLGIQLIPMNPSMKYLRGQGSKIETNTTEALGKTGSYNTQFGDYIAMYRSLAGSADALALSESLPQQYIDDANSRTYMSAWILSKK